MRKWWTALRLIPGSRCTDHIGFGLQVFPIRNPVEPARRMLEVGHFAERLGFDGFWFSDHPAWGPDCWVHMATLAEQTERIRLGVNVACVLYRHPVLMARLYAGIGAGWYEQEWTAYGYEWVATPTRMRQFREGVELIHAMWTEDVPVYRGRHFHIDRPINEPKHSGRGKIPLWIGGGGERVTLKLVAQYGEACNVGGGNPDVIRHKLELLNRHCDKVGRDYDAIIKSTSVEPLVLLEKESDAERVTAPLRGDTPLATYLERAWVGTPDQILERLGTVADAGADYVIVYLPRVAYDHEPLHRFAREVIPHMG